MTWLHPGWTVLIPVLGSNWIPTDHILPMIEESRYRKLLEMAVSEL
jgi:hypothetical protein